MAEGSRPEFSINVIIEIEKQIMKHVMGFLHDSGRVAPCECIIDAVKRETQQLYECMMFYDPNWDLIRLLQSQTSTFYYLQHGEDKFLSLSRDFAYLNPRLAKALGCVTDKHKEALIKFDGPSTSVVNKNLKHAYRFTEYEFAKVALTLLEILDVACRSVSKNRYSVPVKRVTEKYSRLSDLAKSAIHFSSRGDFAEVFQNFLQLFDPIFQIKDSLLIVDFYAFDGLKMSIETDLVRSYAGICVCKGVTSIGQLVEEINKLIERAKLHLVENLTSDTIVPMLQSRNDLYFLPGDDTVWLMSPCLDIPEDTVAKIECFFTTYLRTNSIHYTQCLSILNNVEPSILKDCEEQTSINIASYLYSMPSIFTFEKGRVSLTAELAEHDVYGRTIPVTVPTNLAVHSFPLENHGLIEAFAYVHEVGVRSAIVRFESDCFVGTVPRDILDAVIGSHGFCDRSITEYNNNIVTDFSLHLSEGDFIRVIFRTTEQISIRYPLHITVGKIFALEDSFVRPSYLEYRSPPSYKTDSDSADSQPPTEEQSPAARSIDEPCTSGCSSGVQETPRKRTRAKKKKKKRTK